MRSPILSTILLLAMLIFATFPAQAGWQAQPAAAPLFDDGYALLDAVNQLRAAYGLAPYQTSIPLMISTQYHSIYQASIGTWSHEGADGSDETQRAFIQGYGGGAEIYCDEAVGFGYNYTAQQMVEAWNEPTHLPIMISTRYIDAGAGAAVDAQGRIFYTLDVCYYSGESAVVSASGAAVLQDSGDAFATDTPQPDGSIIHKVLEGESFYSIADDYEMTVDELLELNNLSSGAFLSPGDLLLVRVAYTITPSPEPSLTPTPVIPTATRRPTRTPTLPPQASNTPLPSATPTPQPFFRLPGTSTFVNTILPALAAITGTAGIALVLAGIILKRRH
ncbi:MAG: LysM peptidoglycan-binding domain-containing protein [Anaerolineales bacterium]|jgi:uncharacterized protein YkwD|nr:LysM peptidoglycan-binding domain-containing protein [Anaerolineales bacterium]